MSTSAALDLSLLEAAQAASLQAYAPFSNFRVGAALRTVNGAVFFGANVENSSYGLTRCAEQSAVQAMVARGERQFAQLVVFSYASPPATPCGACRQILFEFAPQAQVFCSNHLGETIVFTVSELLPHGFKLDPTTSDN